MPFSYLLLGFFVKVIAGLDDTVTHVPILASVTKTKMGKLAFSIGTLLAIIFAILVAVFFAAFLKSFHYYRYIIAALIFALAIAIYFDVFVHKPRTSAEKILLRRKRISAERFMKLVGIGFVASVATVLDDIIAYSPLLIGTMTARSYAIAGILLATIVEVLVIIYFAERISKLKYKEEIASAGLVLLGLMTLFGVI